MKTNIILQGDALKNLQKLPEGSIDMVMTSPPYWALRDYNVEGQLGLELNFDSYVNKLCDIFDEVKRVLKKEGTCWVNLGDTYYTKSGASFLNDNLNTHKKIEKIGINRANAIRGKGLLKNKNLCLVPFRFAIEMQKRGWIIRNVIIWHKPNVMPSSVKDRFTVDFEYLFFFSKNKKYYYIKKMCHPKGRNKRTVWKISTKPFKEAHFAVYPPELCEVPINAGCPEGGVVLDPFFGAGTTGVVALRQGKNFIGIELNPDYIKIAEKRLRKAV